MAPRIPPPAHRRGRGALWRLDTKFRRYKASEPETSPEAVLAIRPGRPWLTQTRVWPTQTKFCPTYATPVGLPKICLALWLAYPYENS